MANICFNDITMVGDKAILQRLQDDIERHLNENDGSIYRYGNELYPGSNYEGWFDDVGEVAKANEEEYFLRFTVDTKWTPAMDFFVRLDKGLSFTIPLKSLGANYIRLMMLTESSTMKDMYCIAEGAR